MRLMTGLKAAAADSTNTWAWLLSAAQPKFIAFPSSLERVRFALTFTTLRLNMPQWQGGDESAYRFGSELLRWSAPPHDGPAARVDRKRTRLTSRHFCAFPMPLSSSQ